MTPPTSWDELPSPWRRCFELVWQSFVEGSKPIASVVTNADGTVVATGRSAVRRPLSGVVVSHNEIAHAEVNALLRLDNRDHADVERYTLYASLEPCPVCFGAFYMSGIRQLAFAAKDRFGGSTNLLGTTPYLSRKPIVVDGPVAGLEHVSIFLNIYFDELHDAAGDNLVNDAIAEDYPHTVDLARRLGRADALELGSVQAVADAWALISAALQDG